LNPGLSGERGRTADILVVQGPALTFNSTLDVAAIAAARAIEKGFAQLRALGIGPSDAQVRLNITRALETWAHRLPRSWHDHLRDGLKFLAPHERQTFSQYGRAVELSLQRAIGQQDLPVSPPPKPTKEERAA
jgi:hypothetical protein